MTRQAFHPRPVLTLKQIDDDRVVPLLVDLPLLLARDLWRERVQLCFPLGRHRDRLWTDEHPVQILVQTVQQESEELLRIMLFRSVLSESKRKQISRGQRNGVEKRKLTKIGENLTIDFLNKTRRIFISLLLPIQQTGRQTHPERKGLDEMEFSRPKRRDEGAIRLGEVPLRT